MGSMLFTTIYFVRKSKRGLTFRLIAKWNGDRYFEFFIRRKSDYEYANYADTRKIASVYSTLLWDAVVTLKSVM